MLNLLIRLGMALLGLALLIEVFMPLASEPTKVDRHQLVTQRDSTSTSPHRTETLYRLHFFGGRLESCDVGRTAYDGTADGDAVVVRYSRVFKTCTAIDRKGVTLYTYKGWRLLYVIGGVMSLLAAFGAFRSFEFEGRRVY